MDNEEQFIPGIYNYCDRWCERCEFTARCRNFAMQQEYKDAGYDDSIESSVAIVAESLANAKQMLLEKAEEMGIDIEAAMNDPEIDEAIEKTRQKVEDSELLKLSKKYALDLIPVMNSIDSVLGSDSIDDTNADQMIEIIQWYQFLIAEKCHRALHAVVDIDDEYAEEELSDANGSAKVALLAIERSKLAWTLLLTDENSETVRPITSTLEAIGQLIETQFPLAREFVRPGFDEVETVM